MIWNESSLIQLKKDRAALLLGLESLQTGEVNIRDASSRERLEIRRQEMIEQYQGMLGNMQRDIVELEREKR